MPGNEERHVTPEQVVEVLNTCYDPCCKERAVSVVELGLIQGLEQLTKRLNYAILSLTFDAL